MQGNLQLLPSPSTSLLNVQPLGDQVCHLRHTTINSHPWEYRQCYLAGKYWHQPCLHTTHLHSHLRLVQVIPTNRWTQPTFSPYHTSAFPPPLVRAGNPTSHRPSYLYSTHDELRSSKCTQQYSHQFQWSILWKDFSQSTQQCIFHSLIFTWECTGEFWIGLHLFNDTRPSGHISRPTQVNVAQSCFHSLNKLLKPDYIVQVWRLVEVHKSHHIR